ncbi:MAG: hypothetical protein JO300_15465 [Silvibacterium sp.]|nr:hypothetical protein [Silvibacterium sp.]MBV8437787.1 hypothetical protein [Silvibacterium sp.]
MTESFATPAVMEGHGGYNVRSKVQAAGLCPAVPMLERAAREVALPAGSQPIVIADYGSSQGRNSLVPIGAAIEILRGRIGPVRAISIVHNDRPENDFTALFQTLLSDPNSYLRRDSAAYASAIGRSFYEQILPSESVTLGWSSWAVQWLSKAPGPIPDQVQVAYSKDEATRAAYYRQSAEDWQNFLLARGRELCPGGRLVVLTMALDENRDFGYWPLLKAMYGALIEMVDSGFIREDEFRHMAIPTVGRSRADLLAPFDAEGRFGGLRVEEAEVFIGEDHIWADFEQHRDAGAFGAQWTAFARGSVFPTIAKGLHSGENARTVEFTAEFMDRLEADTAARLAERPERMLIPLGKVLLAKN